MRAVVVYESMFGDTRSIAEAIAEGMEATAEVEVLGVAEADDLIIGDMDLIVVGGPTHIHGMSRPKTRKSTLDLVRKSGGDLVLETGADTGPGVREWVASLGQVHARAAAFDTRLDGLAAFTGRASKGIERELSKHSLELVATPESFLVTKKNHLVAGETERARAWGSKLAALATSEPATG